ncbi:Deoxyribonuclease TATDN3 [Balamuthia mandrillaris]
MEKSSVDEASSSGGGGVEAAANLLFDCHNHFHDDLLESCRELLPRLPFQGLCLMGTRPEDWAKVATLAQENPGKVIPAFGIHPWYAHRAPHDWEDRLRGCLSSVSRCVMVGELGLDKAAKTPDTGQCEYEAQKGIFLRQMEIATELQLPVNVHCVRAFGDLFEFLRGGFAPKQKIGGGGHHRFPPAIVLHSYGGTTGMLCSLLKLKEVGQRLYFSFSPVINLDRCPEEKTCAVIAQVPDDRLLLETDLDSAYEAEEELVRMCRLVAKVKGWTEEETALRTTANARRCLGLLSAQEERSEGIDDEEERERGEQKEKRHQGDDKETENEKAKEA